MKALVGVIVKTGCGTDGSFYSTIQNEDKSACVPVPPLIYTSNEPRQKCQSGQFVKECSVSVRINLLGHNFFAHAKMHPFSAL